MGGRSNDMQEKLDEEEMRRVQWARRRERMRREKRRQELFRKVSVAGIAAVVIIAVVLVIAGRGSGREDTDDGKALAVEAMGKGQAEGTGEGEPEGTGEGRTEGTGEGQLEGTGEGQPEGTDGSTPGGQPDGGEDTGLDGTGDATRPNGGADAVPYKYKTGKDTPLADSVDSSYVIFVDIDEGIVLARREEAGRMNPASMTKVLTLLVAVEHIDNLEDTFTVTKEITDYCFVNDCSNAGFEAGDEVTVRDLLYGTILPSGADAALGLATYVAGSQEAFVVMMNEKLEELGLAESAHFTNCMGIYDENHYCTVYDMAVIMEAAVADDLCREVLSAHTYTTSATKRYPEGIPLSNWFLRRIEDKDTGGEVLCGKTGYVVQSGNCAASYGTGRDGKRYLCVTGGARSGWRCIYDHVDIYKQFLG